jgi:hypothetical protein
MEPPPKKEGFNTSKSDFRNVELQAFTRLLLGELFNLSARDHRHAVHAIASCRMRPALAGFARGNGRGMSPRSSRRDAAMMSLFCQNAVFYSRGTFYKGFPLDHVFPPVADIIP